MKDLVLILGFWHRGHFGAYQSKVMKVYETDSYLWRLGKEVKYLQKTFWVVYLKISPSVSSTDYMLLGSMFHSFGPKNENTLPPYLFWCVHCLNIFVLHRSAKDGFLWSEQIQIQRKRLRNQFCKEQVTSNNVNTKVARNKPCTMQKQLKQNSVECEPQVMQKQQRKDFTRCEQYAI